MRLAGPVRGAGLVTAALLLTGCETALGPLAVANVASVVVVQRGPVDILVSAITGLDCSVVRVSVGQRYCKPIEPPPEPPVYCTRSLAGVDCWDRPNPFGAYQREVADGPQGLTPEQEDRRVSRWPFR